MNKVEDRNILNINSDLFNFFKEYMGGVDVYDKTLDEKDIEIVSNKIISIVKETTNATLRS